MIGTYKLSAKPSLFFEGEFKGELRGVAFLATCSTETMQWFSINCGQFERAFSMLMPRRFATEMVDTLTRGEDIEFPGLYEQEQFGCGFHYEWSPVLSTLGSSTVRPLASPTRSPVLANNPSNV
ncbi:hypothetical protein HDF08_003590 [Edaphobacter lichenicola]|uniref:Uncharacterized protein n=1 Tax=Tunturiibacter lichenicola TaxID=2051959 RepID=A0A852VF61_9BACT|nr:hypothetical protein [Edaphobacter lichenicola]